MVAPVAKEDRLRWDERYTSRGPAAAAEVQAPGFLGPYADVFPTVGKALDVACGQGVGSVWLAHRGLEVWGFDISEVAIGQARDLAQRNGVGDRCHFDVVDLDDGLPAGPPVDVILSYKFRDRHLDHAIIARLAAGRLLAIAVLSEVGAAPGPFRAAPGELAAAFAELELVAASEGQGYAWLLARA